MGVVCTGENRVMVAKVSGEVDHHGAKGMMEEITRQIDTRLPHTFTMDLGAVTFMDSSGIALLLRTHRNMRKLGGKMTVINTPKQAEKVLKAAGLDKMITFL